MKGRCVIGLLARIMKGSNVSMDHRLGHGIGHSS